MLGEPPRKRFRLSEEREKSDNLFFMKHTLAVSDVLIAARLLAQTEPGITLTRMFLERSLRRKIYVEVTEPVTPGTERKSLKVCVEPDCSLEFTIQDSTQEITKPQAWRDFFHVEVYRHLPMETLFKQKVTGYVNYAATGQHEDMFHTSALSIAVIAATEQIALALRRWTEEVLHQTPRQGERFFFRCLDTATTKPIDMFLAPDWQQAFGNVKTPLLLLKEGHVQ
jgi:hypothetical protein